MRTKSETTDRAAGGLVAAMTIGFAGAASMASLMLATGHGILLALLAYAVSGVVMTFAAAAGRLAVDVAAARLGRAVTRRRPRRLAYSRAA